MKSLEHPQSPNPGHQNKLQGAIHTLVLPLILRTFKIYKKRPLERISLSILVFNIYLQDYNLLIYINRRPTLIKKHVTLDFNTPKKNLIYPHGERIPLCVSSPSPMQSMGHAVNIIFYFGVHAIVNSNFSYLDLEVSLNLTLHFRPAVHLVTLVA